METDTRSQTLFTTSDDPDAALIGVTRITANVVLQFDRVLDLETRQDAR